MRYVVYILYSQQLDKYYIGHTGDPIVERIRKHLSNHSGYTEKAKDWKLVFTKYFESKKEAYAFERQIKGKKSKEYIRELIRSSG